MGEQACVGRRRQIGLRRRCVRDMCGRVGVGIRPCARVRSCVRLRARACHGLARWVCACVCGRVWGVWGCVWVRGIPSSAEFRGVSRAGIPLCSGPNQSQVRHAVRAMPVVRARVRIGRRGLHFGLDKGLNLRRSREPATSGKAPVATAIHMRRRCG